MYEKAIQFATVAHGDQKRKFSGDPYMIHPLRVAGRLSNYADKVIAILHDVIEDTDITRNDLSKAGFPDKIVGNVGALTKEPGDDYWGYINFVKSFEPAKRVKIQDICDNLADLPEGDKKHEKYAKALKILIADK